ncbi:MAG TPA: SelB C-terminal domain-containing protein, partial [Thermoanaerobaculia bacterium]|nr:SelB C-terminal domain-containing protein [Thermoanaerobaculia bacterium]
LQSRVRRIEIHDSERDRAVAGDRASLNLPDLGVRDVQRGAQLVEPGPLRPSSLLTVELDLLPASAALKDGARVRVHHLTIEAIGRVRLRAKKRLEPGGREIAQIHLDRPVTAVAGDRFVIRTYSPARTIGGGVILDPHLPRAGRKFSVEDVRQLAGASVGERAGWMARRMGARGITIEDLVAVTGLNRDRIARELASSGTLIPIGDRWLDPGAIDELDARVVKSLEDFFASTPLSTGMPRRELVQKTFPSCLAADAEAGLLGRLRERGRITVEGDVVDLPGREKRPEGVAGSIADRVEACFSGAGLTPPGLREVQDEVGHKPKVIEGVLGFLLKEGTLVRLADGLWVHREALDSASARVREHRGETHDVAWFKDLFGLTRKVGIPLLEWFDANGVTKRVGDQRTIL